MGERWLETDTTIISKSKYFCMCVLDNKQCLLVIQLEKEELDDYKEGVIPHFEFNLKLNDIRNQQSFQQKIHFTGTERFITLLRNPIPG